MKKLTAMVSIYNSSQWLKARLENLTTTTLGNDLEIWCVNADSPDPLDHQIPQEFNVKYVKLNKRNTVYEAWNYILENSNSEYVTNANTDDLVAPNCYEKLINRIETDKSDFAYCNWYVTGSPQPRYDIKLPGLDKSGRPGMYRGDLEKAGVGHFPLWKKSLHQNLGAFDPQFQALADADWWARCFYVGNAKFSWIDEFIAIYQWRNGENLWNQKITAEEWQIYHNKLAKYKEQSGKHN